MFSLMADLISIDDLRRARDIKLDELWRDYLRARERAEHSRDIRDGIAAGRAWGRWLSAFQGASNG